MQNSKKNSYMNRKMKFWHHGECCFAHHFSCFGKKLTRKSLTIMITHIVKKIARTRRTMIMFCATKCV